VIDVDGNRYLDASGGQATSSVGYGNERLAAALLAQLGELQASPSTFPPNA
jgi:4-aminobutyrate aminotransferase-like enzyme